MVSAKHDATEKKKGRKTTKVGKKKPWGGGRP